VERVGPRNNAASLRSLRQAFAAAPTAFSAALESTLHRALANANQRKHEYATLEHLLLALIDDVDASEVMKACKVDLGALKEHLVSSSTLTRTGAGDPVADRAHGAHHPVTPWSQTTWGNRIAFDSDSLGQNRPESGGSFPPRPYVPL